MISSHNNHRQANQRLQGSEGREGGVIGQNPTKASQALVASENPNSVLPVTSDEKQKQSPINSLTAPTQTKMKESNSNNRSKRQGGIVYTFPQKLQTLLNETTDESIVGWNAEGDGFVIRDMNGFTSSLLPTYFRTSKLPSFQRQLNAYGFLRDNRKGNGKTQDEHHAYYHKEFSRANPRLAKEIRRRGSQQNVGLQSHASMHTTGNANNNQNNQSSHHSASKTILTDAKTRNQTKQFVTLQAEVQQEPNTEASNVWIRNETPRVFPEVTSSQLPPYFQSKQNDGNASHSIAQRNTSIAAQQQQQQQYVDADHYRLKTQSIASQKRSAMMMEPKEFFVNQSHYLNQQQQQGGGQTVHHASAKDVTLFSMLPLPPSSAQHQPLPWNNNMGGSASSSVATPQHQPSSTDFWAASCQYPNPASTSPPLPQYQRSSSTNSGYWASSQNSIASFSDDGDLDDAVAAIGTRGLKGGKDNLILNWNTDKEAGLTTSNQGGGGGSSSCGSSADEDRLLLFSATKALRHQSSETSSSDEDREFSSRMRELEQHMDWQTRH